MIWWRRMKGDHVMRNLKRVRAIALCIGIILSAAVLKPMLAGAHPAMSHALRTLSNIRVRNVATLGGHLAHGDPHMDLPPILLTLDARVSIAGTSAGNVMSGFRTR